MMKPDYTLLSKKIRRLRAFLLVSAGINIGVISVFSYWMIHERVPTPYFESKPIDHGINTTPLVGQYNTSAMLLQLNGLALEELIGRLDHTQMIENGYTERDLALSFLISFYDFDLQRALQKDLSTFNKRYLSWVENRSGEARVLTLYPGIDNEQFNRIKHFAVSEQWPMTPKGQFTLLKKQSQKMDLNPSLVETFMLTKEFFNAERLLARYDPPIRKQQLLEILVEGDWNHLSRFSDQQRQSQDLSEARRQKFLLDYITLGSESAAQALLIYEWDFAVKKLDDLQVIAVLQLLSKKSVESEKFAKEMLLSPRNNSVWQQASLRLYEYAGEPIPNDWNYQTSLSRFAPEKNVVKLEQSLRPATATPVLQKEKKSVNTVVAASPSPLKHNRETPKQVTPSLKPKKPQACRLYIVQEGDSLWKISRRFNVDMEVLKDKNQLQSTFLKPGTILKIP